MAASASVGARCPGAGVREALDRLAVRPDDEVLEVHPDDDLVKGARGC
jgi:hypothetical protein